MASNYANGWKQWAFGRYKEKLLAEKISKEFFIVVHGRFRTIPLAASVVHIPQGNATMAKYALIAHQ